jgi:hypothetical protein
MAFLFSFRRSVLVFAAALVPAPCRAQTTTVDPLIGIWGAEVRIGVPVQGELTLDARYGD